MESERVGRAGIWHVTQPSRWPEPPLSMSFSTLSTLVSCPRKWGLSSADYPHVWNQRGFPRPIQIAALEGRIVHHGLQRITRALVDNGCYSLSEEIAVSTLRDLGGFTEVVRSSLEWVLRPYGTNPRVNAVLEAARQRLTERVPDLRSRLQSLLTRIQLSDRRVSDFSKSAQHGERSRARLPHGSYPEIEIQAVGLDWRGFVDLLTLTDRLCEIREFKTGTPTSDHEFQIRTYAVLWARDGELNPDRRLANRLVLSYALSDLDVSAPTEAEIFQLENELQQQTSEALASLQTDPPEARPSEENCSFCFVRHLCGEFWTWAKNRDSVDSQQMNGGYGDVQIRVSGQQGLTTWVGTVESGRNVKPGQSALLRATALQFDVHPGDRLRILNVRISPTVDDFGEERQSGVVATMGVYSEAFLLS